MIVQVSVFTIKGCLSMTTSCPSPAGGSNISDSVASMIFQPNYISECHLASTFLLRPATLHRSMWESSVAKSGAPRTGAGAPAGDTVRDAISRRRQGKSQISVRAGLCLFVVVFVLCLLLLCACMKGDRLLRFPADRS